MLIKITFRKQSEIQNYFEEQGNCIVQKMSPDHNTPKGKGWLKWTTNYPQPQWSPFLFVKLYKPHSPRLTPQRELNEGIKYGERNVEKEKYSSLTKGATLQKISKRTY